MVDILGGAGFGGGVDYYVFVGWLCRTNQNDQPKFNQNSTSKTTNQNSKTIMRQTLRPISRPCIFIKNRNDQKPTLFFYQNVTNPLNRLSQDSLFLTLDILGYMFVYLLAYCWYVITFVGVFLDIWEVSFCKGVYYNISQI